MLISKFSNENVKLHIQEFEEKYKFIFPDQYKKFLLKYNGGETPKTKFKLNKVSSDLRGFFGLGECEKYFNYVSFFLEDELQEYLLDDMIPIGKNAYGDYILIGVGSENNGVIFFRYHDRPKRYIELIKDFDSFIKKCKSEEIGHVDTIEERRAYVISCGNGALISEGLIKLWQAEIDEYANIHQEELILD